MNYSKITSLFKSLKNLLRRSIIRQDGSSKLTKPKTKAPAAPSYEQQIRQHFDDLRKNMTILATTTSPMGQTVDWIPRSSQGTVATPPPAPASPGLGENVTLAVPELEMSTAAKGPEGAVPILRKNLDNLDLNQPLEQFLSKIRGKARLPSGDTTSPPAAQAGVHRYGSSQQAVTAYGTSGSLSYWNPSVQTSGDFSLLQTGVINTQQIEQTAEAGWQVFQALNGDTASHLFTYYTVNGYSASGNNLGGYDTQVTGWVQYDSTIFPGTVFSPYSTSGGTQVAIPIQYQLYQGNWWLAVNGKFIGYYPASLYARNGSTNATLGANTTAVGWWGEVYDDQTEAGGRTTTDMGSGQFPSAGYGGAAFMNNLTVQSDSNGTQVGYNGANGIVQEDPDMYQIQGQWNSGTTWGSYAYVGGPGAG